MHTTGPWKHQGRTVRGPLPGLNTICVAEPSETSDGTATWTIAAAECRDNARLIAAAPELLYALQRAFAVISQHHPEDSGCCKNDIHTIRAAIAKATGKAVQS